MSDSHVVGLFGLVTKKYKNAHGDGSKYNAMHSNRNA